MKLKLLSTLCLVCFAAASWAQGPNGTGVYYQQAHGKKGRELKTAFFNIIKNPSVVHYDSLWTAYNTSDPRTVDDTEGQIIWDMYSGISRYPLYTYPHGTGAGNTEGVKGIQREHSMVKKWFNPIDAPKSGSKTYAHLQMRGENSSCSLVNSCRAFFFFSAEVFDLIEEMCRGLRILF